MTTTAPRLDLRRLLDGPLTEPPFAAYAGLHAAFLLGTEISRHIVWDRDEDIDEGCLHGHLRASEPPLVFRFQMPIAGAEYLEVGVPCPVVAGCAWDSWDELTDRAGLRAVLDGNPASAVCDEHGFAVPAGPMTLLDIVDHLGRPKRPNTRYNACYAASRRPSRPPNCCPPRSMGPATRPARRPGPRREHRPAGPGPRPDPHPPADEAAAAQACPGVCAGPRGRLLPGGLVDGIQRPAPAARAARDAGLIPHELRRRFPPVAGGGPTASRAGSRPPAGCTSAAPQPRSAPAPSSVGLFPAYRPTRPPHPL